MFLELKYKQGNRYCIIYNNQCLTVNEKELISIIKNTPAPQRNCKICMDNSISMKAGYGKMPVRVNRKQYVEIVSLEQARQEAKFIEYCTKEFVKREFKCYKRYVNILALENVEILSNDKIKTKFGVTHYDNLGSGMKSLLVLAYLIGEGKDFIIDLSSCDSNYLNIAFNMIVKCNNNIKVVVHHTDFTDVEIPIKFKGKVYKNGIDYYDEVLDKR